MPLVHLYQHLSGARLNDASGHANASNLIDEGDNNVPADPTVFTDDVSVGGQATSIATNDANGQYLRSTLGLSVNAAFTLMAWFNVTTTAANSRMIGFTASLSSTQNEIHVYSQIGGALRAWVRLANSTVINLESAGSLISAGTWHHLALRFDPSSPTARWSLLMDGSVVASSAIDEGNLSEMAHFVSMARPGVPETSAMIGSLTQEKVWNEALSDATIDADKDIFSYGGGPPPATSNPALGSSSRRMVRASRY